MPHLCVLDPDGLAAERYVVDQVAERRRDAHLLAVREAPVFLAQGSEGGHHVRLEVLLELLGSGPACPLGVRLHARGAGDAEIEIALHGASCLVLLACVEVADQDPDVVLAAHALKDLQAPLDLGVPLVRELLDEILVLKAPPGDVRAHDDRGGAAGPEPHPDDGAHGEAAAAAALAAGEREVAGDLRDAYVVDLPATSAPNIDLVAEQLIAQVLGAGS
mmetsp:Transcript_60718/g.170112  ORF Transcript_60718/g.170112 Transcript_60718/m.170112 type:complete len:219 (-) Transcript_60718:438-1094(-)